MQTIKARGQFPGDYISKRDKRGNTALMIATQRGRTANLEILIRLGVEFNKINKAELPLIVASLAGHANCTRLLVKNRARFLKDGGGDKVLVKAVVSDIVKALIGAEENVYRRDKLGRTYLDQTDQQGNTALMTVLASHALDFHGLSRSHCIKVDSILFCEIASEFRNRKLQWLQLLINAGAELNKVNQEGKSAIMLAAESKEDAAGEYLSLLLAHGGNVNLHDNKGETALMKASCAGNVKQVRTLLQFGADLHLHDQRGRTALMHIAVFNEANDMFCEYCWRTVYRERSPIAQLLADCGSDVNVQNEDGMTVLMMASSKGMEKTVKTLLDCGADVHLKDNSGKTALMHVTDNNELDDDDIYDIFHERYLIEGNENAPIVKMLVDHGLDVNIKDGNGMTALMIACAEEKIKIVLKLLGCGANVNLQDHSGKTALMHAILQHHFYEDDSDDEYWHDEDELLFVIDKLVACGADVNMRDEKGMTAVMHIAASCPGGGSQHLISTLARNHTCLDLLDNEGKCALVHALENCHQNGPCYAVLSLLSHDAFPKLKAANESLASSLSLLRCIRPESMMYGFTQSLLLTRLHVSNGIMPIYKIRHFSNLHEGIEREEWNPLLQALQREFYDHYVEKDLHIAIYLIANCYISTYDMERIRSNDLPSVNRRVKDFLKQAVANPWPLVKLAQIAVSTAIGPSPGRQERILQTGLPRPIMDCLMFNRPIALLHNDWGDIPMCFDPVQYSQQPFQYRIGLLYNWPFGRFIDLCDCNVCKQKEDRFRFTKILK